MRGGNFNLLGTIGLPVEVPQAGHRYWRIYYTETNDTQWQGNIAELVFKDSQGTDITNGGTGFAFSSHGDRPATNAFDKDPETLWGVAATDTALPGYIGYDFGNDADVQDVTITCPPTYQAYADRMPTNFSIQYSDDNVEWTTVKTLSNETWTPGETKSYSLAELTYEALTTQGSGTWTVPAGISEIIVECWGAGGAGQDSDDLYSAGGGGGGGAYVKSTIAVTPSSTINYHIGVSSKSSVDRTTWFIDNTTVLAVGGNSATSRYGADGGLASNCIGDVAYSGGNGGHGHEYYTNPAKVGRGGSSAGPCGDGANGPNYEGAYDPTPTCGTGAGGVSDQGHGDVTVPGRGGDGGVDYGNHSPGYAGQIRISYE